MKRIIHLLLIMMAMLIIPAFAQDVYSAYTPAENEVVFGTSSYKIDAIDPVATTNSKGANYPGLRGANQLVIYTPEFGMSTNTNEFGTEAVVVDGTVVALSGADSQIPADGLVISGHGTAKKWINENIIVGAKISIDTENNQINSYITSESFLFNAKEKVKEAQTMLDYYQRNNYGYNQRKTENAIEKAQEYIEKAQKNGSDSQIYSSKAIEYANSAMATVIPYSQEELKGVWIRPEYYSKQEIEHVLNTLQAYGINNVFIETYYHGKTIYPSKVMDKYGFTKQYENYIGFDPLKIWINEAHKRDIKVHIWFQTFYVGNKPPEANPKSILAVHPEWANYQKRNLDYSEISYSVSEHNGYFIDPANPMVQKFLYELLLEIVNKYKPDGINLDYIRYPQSVASNFSNYDTSNWGYTIFARKEFETMFGQDPLDIMPDDALWMYWTMYRCGKVTNFVKKVSDLCRANRVKLTTVIFPNRKNAIETKMQDWKAWSKNNFVDGFTPLFLTCDDKTVENMIEEVMKNKSYPTQIYAGLFVAFMNGAGIDLIKQIHAVRKYSLNGLIIFDYSHLSDKYTTLLTQSVFKTFANTKDFRMREFKKGANRNAKQ